jgi:hypothetical protein
MCVHWLGTVLEVHLREVVITRFIASAVARAGIGDPTTMLAHGAVEVEAARTMGAFYHMRIFISVKSTSSTIT